MFKLAIKLTNFLFVYFFLLKYALFQFLFTKLTALEKEAEKHKFISNNIKQLKSVYKILFTLFDPLFTSKTSCYFKSCYSVK